MSYFASFEKGAKLLGKKAGGEGEENSCGWEKVFLIRKGGKWNSTLYRKKVRKLKTYL